MSEVVLPCGAKVIQKPVNTTFPCDVLSLRVGVWSDKTIVADLTADAKLRLQDPPDEAPARIRTALSSADLVIEAVSNYHLPAAADEFMENLAGIASATIETTWDGECPEGEHPDIFIVPRQPTSPDFSKDWIKVASPPKVSIPALAPSFLDNNFGWAFFPAGDPLLVDIVAASCGVSYEHPPCKDLHALLRIYAKDDWTIALNLPAVSSGTLQASKDRDLTTGEVTTSKSAAVVDDGKTVWSRANSSTTQGGALTGQSGAAGRYQDGKYVESSIQTNYTDGKSELQAAKEKMDPSQPALLVSRNGSQIDALKAFNDLLSLVQFAKDSLQKLQDLLHIVPKVGCSITITIAFLEGSFTFAMGYTGSNELRGDRYVGVTRYYAASFKLVIIDASVAVDIGFDVTIPNIVDWFGRKNIAEAVLKIGGSLGVKATVTEDVTWKDQPEAEFNVECDLSGKLYAVATAEALGIGLNAEADIPAKFAVDCSIKSTSARPFTMTMDAKLEKGELTAYYYLDLHVWDTSGHFSQSLWDEVPIYQGTFPS